MMTDDAAPTLRTGQRVRYVGLFGNGSGDGPTGRVSRVCKGYVKVRFDDGRTQDLHPEGLQLVSA